MKTTNINSLMIFTSFTLLVQLYSKDYEEINYRRDYVISY